MGRPRKDESQEIKTIEAVEETVTETTSAPSTNRRKATTIDRNEMIPVRSVCYGLLQYVSPRTQMTYVWNDYGTVEWMEFGELLTMKSSKPKFFDKPWIIIEDDDVVAYMGLTEKYKLLINVDDITGFLKKPLKEITALLKASPIGIRETISLRARDMIKSEELNDIRIIKVLENEFKIGLLELMK